MPMPRALSELMKALQWGSASKMAAETPRAMRFPSQRRIPMALRTAQSLTAPLRRTLI
jgi:hypothetical protein